MDLLVLIHGITPEEGASHAKRVVEQDYAIFLKNLDRQLQRQGSSLAQRFPGAAPLQVFWGLPHDGLARDERETHLAQAESAVQAFTGVGKGFWPTLPSPFIRFAKLTVVTQGLADAVYYAAAEGERLVRLAVFGQILAEVAKHEKKAKGPIRLHLVAHSLGVTVVHDLLFDLFNRDPKFKPKLDLPLLKKGRALVKAGRLKLGSFHALASQLSLFALRRADQIPALAQGRPYFELEKLGVEKRPEAGIQFQFFYDPSDALGYPSLELYKDQDKGRYVAEHRVWNWVLPQFYHKGYWRRGKVGQKVAQVLLKRAER